MNSCEASVKSPRTKGALTVTLVILLLVFSLPFVSVAALYLGLPSVYADTFVGELQDKFDRLNSICERKIVIIGGSSVAFGIDSEAMEREIGIPVVNFGLYASLGTKLMLDLSRSNIGSEDIIVIAPEMSPQTLSLYFNAETTLQAIDGRPDMLKYIPRENYEDLIGGAFGVAASKLGYIISGHRPTNTGAYTKSCFDEYGDNDYERPYNVMTAVEPSITLDFFYNGEDSAVSDYEEFIDYVNEYVAFCEERGASVYFSFSPMNRAALSDYNTEENIYAFYDNLATSLHCPVISDINECIMDEGYFFDSEFHLNDSGVTVRTVRLTDDIKRELGRSDLTASVTELPAPPGYAPVDFEAGSEENLYFELTLTKNGAGQDVYFVTGLNEEGKKQITLKIPTGVDGIPVVNVSREAFRGSQVRTLILGNNISSISSCALSGAEKLTAVYVGKNDPTEIGVPNLSSPDGLITEGASPRLSILVPKEAYEEYLNDYFWGDYKSWLKSY